jgi:hypothetical protein
MVPWYHCKLVDSDYESGLLRNQGRLILSGYYQVPISCDLHRVAEDPFPVPPLKTPQLGPSLLPKASKCRLTLIAAEQVVRKMNSSRTPFGKCDGGTQQADHFWRCAIQLLYLTAIEPLPTLTFIFCRLLFIRLPPDQDLTVPYSPHGSYPAQLHDVVLPILAPHSGQHASSMGIPHSPMANYQLLVSTSLVTRQRAMGLIIPDVH